MKQELLAVSKQKLLKESEEILSILRARADKDVAIPNNFIAKANDSGSETEDEVIRFEELEINNDVVQQMEIRLKAVKDALERLKLGSFGICLNCGKEINEDRLIANPAADRCIGCVQKASA